MAKCGSPPHFSPGWRGSSSHVPNLHPKNDVCPLFLGPMLEKRGDLVPGECVIFFEFLLIDLACPSFWDIIFLHFVMFKFLSMWFLCLKNSNDFHHLSIYNFIIFRILKEKNSSCAVTRRGLILEVFPGFACLGGDVISCIIIPSFWIFSKVHPGKIKLQLSVFDAHFFVLVDN